MMKRRPDELWGAIIATLDWLDGVATSKTVAAMEEAVRPAVSATITKINSVSRTPALRGHSANFVIMDETRDRRATS